MDQCSSSGDVKPPAPHAHPPDSWEVELPPAPPARGAGIRRSRRRPGRCRPRRGTRAQTIGHVQRGPTRLSGGDRASIASPSAPPTRREVLSRPEADAALRPRHALHGDDRRGHERHAHAERGQQRARQHLPRRSRRARRRSAAAARRAEEHPGGDHRARPEPGDQPRRERRAGEDRQASSAGTRARPRSRVVEHLLEVQGQEEPAGRTRRVQQQRRPGSRRRSCASRKIDIGISGCSAQPRLDEHERRRAAPARRPAGRARRRSPSRACRCARSRRSTPTSAGGHEHRAGDVEVAPALAPRA